MASASLPIPAFMQQFRLNLGGEAEEADVINQLPDDTVDEVITNGVPVNQVTWLGPGVQSTEIERVLRVGGVWRDNGTIVYAKP